MIPLTLIGGWVVYFIGYYQSEPEHGIVSNALLSVFSAGRLFVLGNDLIEIRKCVKADPNYFFWFSLVGASAVFISSSILLHWLGERLVIRFRVWLNRSNESYIFFGVNIASISLAKDLLKNNRKRLVIFVHGLDTQEDAALYTEVIEIGAIPINCKSASECIELEKEESIIHSHKVEGFNVHSNDSKSKFIQKLHLASKVLNNTSHLFFLSDGEELNMSLAHSVMEEINSLAAKKPITFHIRTVSAEFEDIYQENFVNLPTNISVNLVNLPEIASRELIFKYNPVDWVKKDTQKAVVTSNFTVLIIGFGQTGNSVLKKLVENTQFIGSKFHAIVVDKDMSSKKGRFKVFHPGLISNYKIDLIETSPDMAEFYDILSEYKDQLDYIVLTPNEENQNIRNAIEIQQYLLKIATKNIRIIARVNDSNKYNLPHGASEQIRIVTFGREKDTFSENIVVRGDLEKSAKKIHEYYNSKKKSEDKQQSWNELSKIKQLSNISAANSIYTKLRLAGLTIQNIKQCETADNFVDTLGKGRIDNLAITEHLRWNALHFANGWNTWKLADIPKNAASNKNEQKKLHACLVDWNDLALVKERFNEDYYSYDYENVVRIFELIKEGIYTENQH
jgi:hypothetical protein